MSRTQKWCCTKVVTFGPGTKLLGPTNIHMVSRNAMKIVRYDSMKFHCGLKFYRLVGGGKRHRGDNEKKREIEEALDPKQTQLSPFFVRALNYFATAGPKTPLFKFDTQ